MAEMKFHSVGPALEEGISQVTQTPSVNIGTRRIYNGEEYVYCYNAGGGTASQKAMVKIITGASGYSVAATALTDALSPAVGVVKHVAMAAGDYGWVMTKGFASVKPTSALTGDYFILACGASGEVVQWAGTGPTQGVQIGYAIGANCSASVASLYAYINTGF